MQGFLPWYMNFLGEYNGVGPLGVSVIQEFVQHNPDSEEKEMGLWANTCGYDTELYKCGRYVSQLLSLPKPQKMIPGSKQRNSKDMYNKHTGMI